MTTPAPSRASGLVAGTVWMIAMRWVMRGLGLFSTVVLARLLTPEDFGVVAIALIVVGLLETIAYLGVDLSLIKDQSAGREEFDSAWTVQLIQGGMVAALLVVAAPLVAAYFNEPRAAAVIWWLALRPVIESFQNIGLVTFRKDLDFAREFRFNLIAKLLGVGIQISAALLLRSYWALVVGMIAASSVGTLLSYLLHPYRPRPTLSRVGKIWSFSQWLLVSRVGSFFSRRCDEFVVGNLAGTAAMGSYHVVYELATAPTTEIIMPMRRALFPALAKLADDAVAYRKAVLDSLSASTAICMALGVGLASSADLVVPLVLGDKWVQAVPLLRWLALFGVTAAVLSVMEVPLWVAGRTRLSAAASWLELLLAVPLLLLAVKHGGAQGAAACRLAVSLAMLPVAALMARSACGIGLRHFAAALARPVLAGALMAAAMAFTPAPTGLPMVITLALRLLLGALAYSLALWLLWHAAGRPDGIEANVVGMLKRRLAKRAAH